MRDMQEFKDEIRRRGEERIEKIARNRRRAKAIISGAAMCGFAALALTVAVNLSKTPVPIAPPSTVTTTTNAGGITPTASDTTATATTTLPTSASATDTDTSASGKATTVVDAPVSTTVATTATIGTTPSTVTTPTINTTVPSTTVTTPAPTTTTGKPPLIPLPGIHVINAFKPAATTGKVGDVLDIPFSLYDYHGFISGSADITFDPLILQPLVSNTNDASNPYVTDLNDSFFVDGSTITSYMLDEDTLRITISLPVEEGSMIGCETFHISFCALSPTPSYYVLISDSCDIQYTEPDDPNVSSVWGSALGRLVITE